MSSDHNKMTFIPYACVLLFIVFGLCPDVTAGKPKIIAAPSWTFIENGVFLIQFGDELRIECQGKGELQFSTQKLLGDSRQSEYNITKDPTSGSYIFIREHTIPEDTGWYACAEKGIEITNDDETTEHPIENISWIYVYVNSSNPFAVMHEFDFPVITALAGGRGVVPCRPSSPGLPVILTSNGDPFYPQKGQNVSYNPKIGFTINPVDGGADQQSIECQIDGIDIDPYPVYTWNVKTVDPLSDSDVKTDKWLQVARGENFTLYCNITVYKGTTAELEWETPNAVAENRSRSPSNIFRVPEDDETHSRNLTITNAQERDAGEYTCIVQGSVDRVKSSTSVIILDPDKPFINCSVNGNKSLISGFENGEAIWMIYINTYPPADIKWYKNGNLIENVGSDISSKYSMLSDATTYLYQISSLDINDNGNYTIRISTSNETKDIPLQLAVEVKPVNVIRNYSRLYKPGDTAVLFCNTTGSPTPLNVNWTFSEWSPKGNVENISLSKYAKPLQKKSAFSAVSNLSMLISSMGNLTCSACNEGGCTDTTVPIFASDVDGFFGINGQNSVVEGDNLTLICAASLFYYTNNIGWILKNPTKLGSNEIRINVTSSTNLTWQSRLEIRDVKLSDAGIYSCRAENKSGQNDMINHTLVVVESSKVSFNYTNLYNKDMHIDLNKEKHASRNLTCVAKGMPLPKVTWYKNGAPLTWDTQYQLSSNKSTLFILHFRAGEGGNYSCIAENRLNSVERYVNIIVAEKSNNIITWISLICVLIIIIIVVITYMGIKVHRERILRKELLDAGLTHFEEGALECLNPDLTLDDQAELLPYDKKWEFPRELLKLGKQLGSGAFGVVMKAEARGICVEDEVTTVAVKMVRRSADPSYMKALSSELKIMIHLGKHLNVVNLLGACTKTILTKRELYVIVEYCRYGNLHNYLQRHRESFIDQIDPVTKKIDPNFGIELLARTASVGSQNKSWYGAFPFSRSNSGISYNSNSGSELIDYRTGTEFGDVSMSPEGGIISNNSVQPGWRSNYRGDYRDQNLKPICTQDLLCWTWQVALGMEYLSARNVLHGDLAARNILLADDNVVKICDFGLAKNMYKDDNYKKKGDGPLPIKWMAVESIRDRIFSTQSDVWSFGIVLWEFFTLARTPYPGMEAEKQYERLIEGYRMEKPEYATDEIYDFMLDCWKAKPSLRPSFPELAQKIGTLLREGVKMHYLELNTPYMDMNIMAKQNGQNDYLTMMSAPTHDYPGSPDPILDGPSSSGYLSMSPVSKTSEPGIFSPRSELEESHFPFSPPSQPAPIYPNLEDCTESVPMLLPSEPNVKPADVQQKQAEFSDQSKQQTSIDSRYSNFTPNMNLSQSNNLSSDIVKDSDQTLDDENLLKNNNELNPPTMGGLDNYVNLPQQKTDRPKDLVDSYSNPSYVIVTKPEDNRLLV